MVIQALPFLYAYYAMLRHGGIVLDIGTGSGIS